MPDLVPRNDIADITALPEVPLLNTFASTKTGVEPAGRGLFPIGTVPATLMKTQSLLCEVFDWPTVREGTSHSARRASL